MNKQLETELKHRKALHNPTAGAAIPAVPPTLEDLLDALARRGKVSLHYFGDGWSCKVELFVTTEVQGTKFEVHSGFNHPTASKAASVCLERTHEALARRYD